MVASGICWGAGVIINTAYSGPAFGTGPKYQFWYGTSKTLLYRYMWEIEIFSVSPTWTTANAVVSLVEWQLTILVCAEHEILLIPSIDQVFCS